MAMEWPAVRQLLQGLVPRSYWTALERHDDGAWTAYTPGLPVDGGMTIAGSRSAAYLEAQRRIAVTIRNMYEVGQRVPPSASAMSLSAAQAWDSSHREVFEQLDEDLRGGPSSASQAPKIVERQWRQLHVDLSLADDSPVAADRAELREALRQRGVRNIWASDPESGVDEEEEEGEGDDEVDAEEEEDDDMLDMEEANNILGSELGNELGIVASEEPPTEAATRRERPAVDYVQVDRAVQEMEEEEAAFDEAEREDEEHARRGGPRSMFHGDSEFYRLARRGRVQRRATGSALEALADVVAPDAAAQRGAAPWELPDRLPFAARMRTVHGQLEQEAGPAVAAAGVTEPDQAAGQQPSLRALEHREVPHVARSWPERIGLVTAGHNHENVHVLRREEAARTTRRHMERQRSFSRLYQAARAGIARPAGAHRAQAWKEGEATLC